MKQQGLKSIYTIAHFKVYRKTDNEREKANILD